jgi:predicted AAA+ superfamily ATPase
MERSGKQVSVNKIAKILSISPDTAKRYFNYFERTFMIHLVSRNGTTNERILSAKKVYAGDIGVRNYFTGYRDIGSIFENYVYLKIKHLSPEYIYQDTEEIDFFTTDKYLVEAKYHNEELSKKQQKLFDKITANKKFIIRNEQDITNFLNESKS